MKRFEKKKKKMNSQPYHSMEIKEEKKSARDLRGWMRLIRE